MSKFNINYENKSEPISASIQHMLSTIPHMHKELELIYVLEGETVAVADLNHYEIKKGDLFIAFPNQVHYYEKCSNGKYLVLIFSYDALPYLSTFLKGNIPIDNTIKSADESLCDFLQTITQISGEYKNTELCGYLNLIMSFVMPKMTFRANTAADSSTLRNILNYCSANFSENPSLDEAADALHLSKYYISHILNGRLRLSFTDYLNTLRINAACDALLGTEKRISDISEDFGFGTIRTFNRAFKDVMGLTPQDYRKSYKS